MKSSLLFLYYISFLVKNNNKKNREIERNLSFFFQRDTLYQCRVYDDRDRVVNGTKPLVTEIEIPVYVAEKFSDTCSEAPADGIQWPRTKKVLVLQDSDVDRFSITLEFGFLVFFWEIFIIRFFKRWVANEKKNCPIFDYISKFLLCNIKSAIGAGVLRKLEK